jgi:hypothetical protein
MQLVISSDLEEIDIFFIILVQDGLFSDTIQYSIKNDLEIFSLDSHEFTPCFAAILLIIHKKILVINL